MTINHDLYANLELLNTLGIDPKAVMLAQLRYLRDAFLDEQSFEHDHWTDDCGDYANAALRLAQEIQHGYLTATELGAADAIIDLARTDHGTGWSSLWANYACDGFCPELHDAVRAICKATGLPFFDGDEEDA